MLAHIAQTGHIVRLKNRPGSVHDSKQAWAFLREIIEDLRRQVGRGVILEFRMDAAFFQRRILQGLAARDCGYAIKVGYWSWLPLKPIAAACRRWQPVAPRVTGHETELAIPPWNNLRLRVVLSRKHVGHRTPKNFQLYLFTPDDGHYEYSAVATNLPLGLAPLWAFACGRGAQEKTNAELRGEFALDVCDAPPPRDGLVPRGHHFPLHARWRPAARRLRPGTGRLSGARVRRGRLEGRAERLHGRPDDV